MKSISVTNSTAYSIRNPDEILEMIGWADERVKNVLHCARCIPGLLTHPNRFRVESHSFTLCSTNPTIFYLILYPAHTRTHTRKIILSTTEFTHFVYLYSLYVQYVVAAATSRPEFQTSNHQGGIYFNVPAATEPDFYQILFSAKLRYN